MAVRDQKVLWRPISEGYWRPLKTYSRPLGAYWRPILGFRRPITCLWRPFEDLLEANWKSTEGVWRSIEWRKLIEGP